MRHMGITHIINTAVGTSAYHVNTDAAKYRKVGIEFLGIEATDHMNFQLHPYFEECAEFIDKALENGGEVPSFEKL